MRGELHRGTGRVVNKVKKGGYQTRRALVHAYMGWPVSGPVFGPYIRGLDDGYGVLCCLRGVAGFHRPLSTRFSKVNR